ncbi:MAG: class II aldolase/adducin family protein [Spirochaetes bacterium]|nr:class II aldolase/adducin family protein [Spirochaetota bacterium]
MEEGIIKFKIERRIKNFSIEASLYEDIDKARKILRDYNLIGVYADLKLGYGNISKKLNEKEFLISGSQTGHLESLNGSFWSVIEDSDFNNNSVKCKGGIEPSSETLSHSAFYTFNKSINCVIHIHQKIMWLELIKNGYMATSPNAEYGSRALYKELIELIKNNSKSDPIVIAMSGHEDGILVAGSSINITLDKTMELYNKYI